MSLNEWINKTISNKKAIGYVLAALMLYSIVGSFVNSNILAIVTAFSVWALLVINSIFRIIFITGDN